MGRVRREKGEKKGPGRKARKQAPPDFTQLLNKNKRQAGQTNKRVTKRTAKNEEEDQGVDDFEPFANDSDDAQAREQEVDSASEFDGQDGEGDEMEHDGKQNGSKAKNGTGREPKSNGGLMINITQGEPRQRVAKDDARKQTARTSMVPNGATQTADADGASDDEEPAAEGEDDDDEAEETGRQTIGGAVTNLKALQARIKKVSVILSDFANRRETDRTRRSYTDELCTSLATYYGYNPFLMRKFYELFPNDIVEFLEANEHDRPLTIRTNTLKTKRRDLMTALQRRGVQVEVVGEWSKVGLVVYDSHVPIGATPEYLAGHYVLQGASSWLPVMALAPQLGERVLDMCAAPGGKTSHIAALLRNGGLLLANDANRDRLKAVVGNLHRLGVNNAVVSARDGCELGRSVPNAFDRVLLDAPCSGSGVIAKDASVKSSKTETDLRRCSTLQKRLLLAAIDACNARSSTGGYIVYSTCSVFVEENEAVIQYALRKRFVKIVETGVDFGHEGFSKFLQYRFNQRMRFARRVYPHTHNMDGFFFCKLKKLAEGERVDPTKKPKAAQTAQDGDVHGVDADAAVDADADTDAASQKNQAKRKNKKPAAKSTSKRQRQASAQHGGKAKAKANGKAGKQWKKRVKLLANVKVRKPAKTNS